MPRHKVTDVFTPDPERKQTRSQIAQEILGPIDWIDDSQGYCRCPGEHLHTQQSGHKDTKIFIGEGAPTVHCFHQSCSDVVAEANHKLRSAIGKLEASDGRILSDIIPMPRRGPEPDHDWSTDLKPIEAKAAWIHSFALPESEDLPELQSEMFQAHLSLYSDDDNIWVGDTYATRNIQRTEIWRKLSKPPGNFISHCTFTPDADGRKNAYVESVKFLVVESDTLTKSEQRSIFAWLQQHCGWSLRLVIDTAGKSLHGWFDYPLKVDLKQLKALLKALKCDVRLLTASQPSRVAGASRDGKLQHILWIGQTTANERSWDEIIAIPQESLTDDNGREFPIDDLLQFDTQSDPNSLLGKRWLCKRGSLQIVGESGIGKSSLVVQAGVTWALGRAFFGIEPARPLRVLIIQRENDEGDMAEEMQGVFAGLELDKADRKTIGQQLKIIQNDTLTGMAWAKWLQGKIMQHQADLVFVDPLLSFADGEISKQADATRFCRRELQPVLNATGCALVAAHHTGKPRSEKDRPASLGAGSYAGLGSSEFTNWFRAVMVLQKTGDNLFTLSAEKRGKRAGLTRIDGQETTAIKLRHASEGICWEQVDETSFQSDTGAVVRLGNSSAINADGFSEKGQFYRDAGITLMPALRHDKASPQFSQVLPFIAQALGLGEVDGWSGSFIPNMAEAEKEWERIRKVGAGKDAKCKRVVTPISKGLWKGTESESQKNANDDSGQTL